MELKEIGLSLFGIGVMFQFLGLIASDGGLVGAGNLVAVIGVVLTVRTNVIGMNFMGVLLFVLGVVAVFRRLVFMGFLLEVVGLVVMVNMNLSLKGLMRRVMRKMASFIF